jgi:hypothetical protein
MKRTLKRLTERVIIIITYFAALLFAPVASAEAVNAVESPADLDERIAGLVWGRS